MSELSVVDFYVRTSWPLGTTVVDPDNPGRYGVIVKRGAHLWVDRAKVPLVRWHGCLDATPVAWDQLVRAGAPS